MLTGVKQVVAAEAAPYSDNWEYIADELGALDLLLHHRMLQRPPAPACDSLAAFKSLVVTDPEILGPLAGAPNAAGDELLGEQRRLERARAVLQSEILARRDASWRGRFLVAAAAGGIIRPQPNRAAVADHLPDADAVLTGEARRRCSTAPLSVWLLPAQRSRNRSARTTCSFHEKRSSPTVMR
jgi:hypothetical protein